MKRGKPKTKKQRRAKAFRSRGWLEKLATLQKRRAPYEPLYRSLFEQTLTDYCDPGARTLELGAGSGQLLRLLDAQRCADWLHSDPDTASLQHLKQHFSGVSTLSAKAERLPLDATSFDTVVGLCVLDVVDDIEAVAREQARILKPGGRFLHWLDMTTALEKPFESLVAAELLPLPNLFSDPHEEQWPNDLVVVPFAPLRRLLEALKARNHPLLQVFGPYFTQFFIDDFNASKAAQSFHAIADNSRLRQHLQTMFTDAQATAVELGLGPTPAHPASSVKHIARTMQEAFLLAGFEIEQARVVTRWMLRDQPRGDSLVYRSLCIGHERLYSELPESLLCADARTPDPGQQLVETGVHLFVARRP